MDKTNNIPTLTTIGIDRQTSKLIDKLCKRYSLKKGEIVRLAFVYIDKACINPSEATGICKIGTGKDKQTAGRHYPLHSSLRGRTTKSHDTNGKFYCGSV